MTHIAEVRTDGSLMPLDPRNGRQGHPRGRPVQQCFTPDGKPAIEVARFAQAA